MALPIMKLLHSMVGFLFLFHVPVSLCQEIAYVLEPFETVDDSWAVLVHKEGVLSLSLVQDDALFGESALQFAYEVVQSEVWGGFVELKHFSNPSYNCAGATHISLWYKIRKTQTASHRAHFRLTLMDDSDCDEGDCDRDDHVEHYYSFHDILDHDSDGESDWQEIRVELEGSDDPNLPFWRTGWIGQVGNGVLDASHLKGWRLEVSIDSQGGIGNSSEGILLLDQLACVGDGDLFGSAFQYERGFAEGLDEKVWSGEYFQLNTSKNMSQAELESGRLSINFTIAQTDARGGLIDFQHTAPGNSYYNLSGAESISFKYNVSAGARPRDRSQLRAVLLDASHCSGSCDLLHLEHYYSFYHILDDNGNGQISTPLPGNQESISPFWIADENSIIGNGVLDIDQIKGFRFEIRINGIGDLGSLVSGTCDLSHLGATIPNRIATNPSVETIQNSMAEPDLHFKLDFRLFDLIEFHTDNCYQECASDPSCIYYQTSHIHCYIASSLEPSSIQFLDTDFRQSRFTSFWMTGVEKRGDFCDICECRVKDRTIDCQGRDLLIVPKTVTLPSSEELWKPQVLDLRGNPRLVLLGTGSLDDLPTLEELRLPVSTKYISPLSVGHLRLLRTIVFEGDVTDTSNVVSELQVAFSDVCCGRGDQLSLEYPSNGITFCKLHVKEPGDDSIYEPFIQYMGGNELEILTPSSPFMAEAAESYSTCAEYCAFKEDCNYFSYDNRKTKAEPTCLLLASKGKPTTVADYGNLEETEAGWVSGMPPRTRNQINDAKVLFSSEDLVADKSNSYQSTLEVSLGAMPLMGAVWVELHIENNDKLNISIFPTRVALYDNVTTTTIEVKVFNAETLSSSERVAATIAIDSCDRAFALASMTGSTLFLQVEVPSWSNGSSRRAMILVTLSAISVVIIVILCGYRRRKQLDSVWMVKTSELAFEEPIPVIGRGTFGLVLLAEYRGTRVAIKRVIPPRGRKHHKRESGSIFGSMSRSWEVPSLQGSKKDSEHSDVEAGHRESREFDMSVSFASHASTVSFRGDKLLKATSSIPATADRRGTLTTMNAPRRSSSFKFWRDEYSVLKEEFVSEMRHLARLRHPCVTTVMGAVISTKEEPMLVMEYMDHGSLYDLLNNDTMPLDGEYILPILQDIALGLRFLHAARPQVIHGDLKSRNILVDGKFRAKVADFGLSQKHQLGVSGTPYWMAPELLRGEGSNSAKSDVYSFGMILYEVYSRQDPYEGEDFDEVIRQIADPMECKRPMVPQSCPVEIKNLMSSCLAECPEKRPTFEDLDITLRLLDAANIGPGETTMTSRVKKHHKTNSLLLDVFPPHIAQALMNGRKVQPESHSMVTIFFSDIVGFTVLSSEMPPMKISDMIDRLYTRLDALSQQHGVFKLETIGDAWMGACNLIKNQDEDHVKRVAEFAIDAVKAAGDTLIDVDDPSKGFIHIRAGFHSGAVVANVVGSITPKYCLFGDAVNTASRMESSSKTDRIHCSEISAKLLRQQSPAIRIKSRGKIEVKGKGEMQTYWINENPRIIPSIAARPFRRLSAGHMMPRRLSGGHFVSNAETHGAQPAGGYTR